jgi:hypothetical protein
VVTTVIPGIGNVFGKKALADLVSGATPADKKEDKPAVVSTPIAVKQP